MCVYESVSNRLNAVIELKTIYLYILSLAPISNRLLKAKRVYRVRVLGLPYGTLQASLLGNHNYNCFHASIL